MRGRIDGVLCAFPLTNRASVVVAGLARLKYFTRPETGRRSFIAFITMSRHPVLQMVDTNISDYVAGNRSFMNDTHQVTSTLRQASLLRALRGSFLDA